MSNILVCGDFFCGEKDDFDLLTLDNYLGHIDCKLIMNFEGAWAPIPTYHDSKNKVILEQSNKISVSLTQNIYYSIYNNHTTDFGPDGVKVLKHKLAHPNSKASAKSNGNSLTVNDQKIVFLGDEKEGVSCQELDLIKFRRSAILRNQKLIHNAHVIVHGGLEYRKHPTPYQRSLAHLIIRLGAKSVIFHHSHIEGTYEILDGKLIHYGLGNFFFTETFGLHGHDQDTRLMIMFDQNDSWDFYQLTNEYSLERKERIPVKYPDQKHYSSWYKSQHTFDLGLRPRQLFTSEILTHLQFKAWHIFASNLVRMGISKKIKKILSHVLR